LTILTWSISLYEEEQVFSSDCLNRDIRPLPLYGGWT
jgi:hypothetical protein